MRFINQHHQSRSLKRRFCCNPMCFHKSSQISVVSNKIALVFANSYSGSNSLGDGPKNDAALTIAQLHNYGYATILASDPSKKDFKMTLKTYLSKDIDSLFIYFSGHGLSITDRNGDEIDGMDEALVFKDGYILDDDLYSLMRHHKCKRLILMVDSCHSGSIFDIHDDPSILTISACQDNEQATQTKYGLFTHYFWRYLTESSTTQELISKINVKLQKYKHQCVINGDVESFI